MRNKQEFEQRVYELYELKKRQRLSYMRRFTVVGAGVLVAASMILVFTIFGRDGIKKNPEKNSVVGMSGMVIETGHQETITEVMNSPTWAVDEEALEDGGSMALLGATVYMYPSEEKVELNEEEAEEFRELVRNMDIIDNVQMNESASENFYIIKFDYGYKITEVIYNDGFRKIDDGDWIKCSEEDSKDLETILEKFFKEG